MAASFILLLLPILRRRRRNKPDSLVNRRPLQKRVVRVNASVVLVQGRWALESDLALEFFYVRFAQLVVLSCTQREERERRVSRQDAREGPRKEFKYQTERKTTSSSFSRRGGERRRTKRTNRRAWQRNSSSSSSSSSSSTLTSSCRSSGVTSMREGRRLSIEWKQKSGLLNCKKKKFR